MYVASTRAKDELYIMVPRYYNMKNIRGYLSPFINKNNVLKTMRRNIGDRELLQIAKKPVYIW